MAGTGRCATVCRVSVAVLRQGSCRGAAGHAGYGLRDGRRARRSACIIGFKSRPRGARCPRCFVQSTPSRRADPHGARGRLRVTLPIAGVHFDAAEWAYEALFVPALFGQWAPRVADAAQVQPGQRVLDVACGTGILARELLSRVGPSGRVVGIDPSPGMMAVAERLAPSVTWVDRCTRRHRGTAAPYRHRGGSPQHVAQRRARHARRAERRTLSCEPWLR